VTAAGVTGLAALLTAGALCNDAALRPPAGEAEAWTAVGDPTEAALLAAAARFGLDPGDLQARFPRVAEVPFDSTRKRMTTAHRLPGGDVRVICKGAPEVMLTPEFIAGDDATLARAAGRAEELARGGFRVLAVAAAGRAAPPDAKSMKRGLHLLGLTAILDPPRSAAAATIASCQAAGITPVLITGDHPATAGAIARDLGIIGDDAEVVDCRADGHEAAFGTARVFARATPEQKLAIIAARQAAGDVVAMTGDGVNDGPALRRADIGVAMGRRGTEVARQAADLVLADDELGTVVAAAEEGRRVYANIRRFLLYGLAGGSAEIAVMLAGPLVGLALLWAVAGALGLQFAGIYLPFLNDLLKTRPLTGLDLLVVFALSTLGYAAIRLDRVLHKDGRWLPGTAAVPVPGFAAGRSRAPGWCRWSAGSGPSAAG
jgi:Ca2+-transporting ATPase